MFLFPPGTGNTHLAISLSMRSCQAAHRVLFSTAAEWVARLAVAHHSWRIHQELTLLRLYSLLFFVVVFYIPFLAYSAYLFFLLVSSRYVLASLIVTSY